MNDAFERARQCFFDGLQALEAGRLDDAERSFEASLALVPGRASTLTNLGAVRIRLGRPAEALPLLDEAVAAQPEHVEGWLQRALALERLGRDAEALPCFERVLAQAPDDAPTLYRTAMALNRLGRHADALARLEHLLRVDPEHARGWTLHGQTLQSLERHDDALPSYERALALDPTDAWAWTLRGGLLKDLGRRDEAIFAFEQAIAHGGDAEYNGYFLAALGGRPKPARAPGAYVQQLFDGYAERFDEHLVQVLNYRSPQMLAQRIAALGRRFGHALDLGCGTGLCGPLVAPVVVRLDGVDLSQAMLDKARALGVYAQLDRADLVDHLRTTPHRHDLVLAADVFTYLGDLSDVFAGVARVLEPGGWFVFSVERADDGLDFELRGTLRYAHSARYLRTLAASGGFDVGEITEATLREDQRRPIAGLLVLLQRR
jgi:predicted TPR repeat methyltransferase